MRRLITSALILGLLSFTSAGLVGCGDEMKTKEKDTVSTPGGTTTETKEHKVESSGSNPPASPSGEVVK